MTKAQAREWAETAVKDDIAYGRGEADRYYSLLQDALSPSTYLAMKPLRDIEPRSPLAGLAIPVYSAMNFLIHQISESFSRSRR